MLNQLPQKPIIKLSSIFYMIKIEVCKKRLKFNKLEKKQINFLITLISIIKMKSVC